VAELGRDASAARCAHLLPSCRGARYLDAAPVRGVLQGGAGEKMEPTCWWGVRAQHSKPSCNSSISPDFLRRLLVDTGLVMFVVTHATTAGVDQINTFRTMATSARSYRVLVLMSAEIWRYPSDG